MDNYNYERLLDHVNRLESADRRRRHINIALLMVVILLFFGGANGKEQMQPLNVSAISIVDDNNRPLVYIGKAENQHVGIALYDVKGNNRASLQVNADGLPGLSLYDEHGKNRVKISVEQHGQPVLIFYNNREEVRVNLELGANGAAGLTFRGNNKDVYLSFGINNKDELFIVPDLFEPFFFNKDYNNNRVIFNGR